MMKFADHLSKSDIQKFNQLRKGSKQRKPESKPKRKKELSFKDWEDIMGKNRDTYIKVGGRVRSK
ncbi:hypothetical protein [Bacillus sp. mrc49]|uniref:hypothetical protein n=1 Tax=Bacillus sp. mrc49 TaxID=2054913 RepID=UPI0012FDFEF1|nr:hypothetical protein [Bacillus sp. mrc49]